MKLRRSTPKLRPLWAKLRPLWAKLRPLSRPKSLIPIDSWSLPMVLWSYDPIEQGGRGPLAGRAPLPDGMLRISPWGPPRQPLDSALRSGPSSPALSTNRQDQPRVPSACVLVRPGSCSAGRTHTDGSPPGTTGRANSRNRIGLRAILRYPGPEWAGTPDDLRSKSRNANDFRTGPLRWCFLRSGRSSGAKYPARRAIPYYGALPAF